MKTSLLNKIAPLVACAGLTLPGFAQEEAAADDQAKTIEKHQAGSEVLAVDQDELAADVQELIDVQTDEGIVTLLEEVEEIMAEVTGRLDESETGGVTIAAETEIIEKIFDAAKKRSQQSGGT